MLAQAANFAQPQTICAFPKSREDLPGVIRALGLSKDNPLIMLIGGYIHPEHADVTHEVLQSIAQTAEEVGALIISGGTHTGVMGTTGQIRSLENYSFPLVGVVPQDMPIGPGGPTMRQYMHMEDKRIELARYFSHMVLVPGGKYGNEASWIVDLAAGLAPREASISILVNGVNVTRKDIQLNLQAQRKIFALSGTSRLGDEYASRPLHDPLIRVIPAADTDILARTIRTELGWK